MPYCVNCVLNDKQPLATGEDGRTVIQIISAAYQSAGTARRVEWPYEPLRDKTPIQVWR